MKNVRLIKPIPRARLRLVSGMGDIPSVGDLGETDQFYSADGYPMVLVSFVSDDGATEWEAEAYEAELEALPGVTSNPFIPTAPLSVVDQFTTLRRSIGLLMLVVACLFAAACIRSCLQR